jgi:hypothetical protein
LALSSLMNPLSTRLKLYRLAIGACVFDAADSWSAAFSPSFELCAHEYPQGQTRITASASVETRMAPTSKQRWDISSLSPTRHRLNLNACECSVSRSAVHSHACFSPPKFLLFRFISTTYAAGSFLDSMKRDKYGPRGF